MKKKLTYVRRLDKHQIEFGSKIGLDLRGYTFVVAAARIEDSIRVAFYGETLDRATRKQAELAYKFGFDISDSTRRVARAVIADIMEQLDHEAIIGQGLAPEVTVINVHDDYPATYVISSIQPDRMVFFKGGNGKKAYARSLKRYDGKPDSLLERKSSDPRISNAATSKSRSIQTVSLCKTIP